MFKKNNFEKRQLLLTPHTKLVVVLAVFLLSLFSGVSDASEYVPGKTVFVKQAKAMAFSSQGIRSLKLVEKPVTQVSIVVIGEKKQIQEMISEKPTPTTQPEKVSEQPEENKSSSDKKTGEISSETQIESQSNENSYLQALNAYRDKNAKAPLVWDNKLADYAQSRADLYNSQGAMDGHKGFNDFLNNQDGFKKLGFNSLGENSGYGHTSDPASLIAEGYGTSPSHNENQLNAKWSHVGIGVSGTATNFVFGGNKQ